MATTHWLRPTLVVAASGSLLLLYAACTATLPSGARQTSADASSSSPDASGAAASRPAETGALLFAASQTTADDGAASASCAQCHGDDGSGGRGPSLGGLGANTLQTHAQGDGQHLTVAGGRIGRTPEVKFPELTAVDFEAIAAFLADG